MKTWLQIDGHFALAATPDVVTALTVGIDLWRIHNSEREINLEISTGTQHAVAFYITPNTRVSASSSDQFKPNSDLLDIFRNNVPARNSRRIYWDGNTVTFGSNSREW